MKCVCYQAFIVLFGGAFKLLVHFQVGRNYFVVLRIPLDLSGTMSRSSSRKWTGWCLNRKKNRCRDVPSGDLTLNNSRWNGHVFRKLLSYYQPTGYLIYSSCWGESKVLAMASAVSDDCTAATAMANKYFLFPDYLKKNIGRQCGWKRRWITITHRRVFSRAIPGD